MSENAAAAEGGKKGSPIKMMLLIIIGAIVVIGVSMGGTFFILKTSGILDNSGGADHAPSHEAPVAAVVGPPIYFPLDPAFVINFREKGRSRFLQVTIEIMTRDQATIDSLTTHTPVVRNNILMLLSSQDSETLRSVEGKEKLLGLVLETLQNILKEQASGTAPAGNIEKVFFTSFVIQ